MNASPPSSGASTFESIIAECMQKAQAVQAEEEAAGRRAARIREKRHRWYEGYYDSPHKADELLYVPRTDEFRRVSSLPVTDPTDAKAVAEFLTRALKKPEGTMALWETQGAVLKLLYDCGGVLGSVSCGGGKGLAHGEPVLTVSGWTPIEDIQVGDLVAGSDGSFYPVEGVYPQGEKDLYRMHFTDGSYVDCDEDHLWTFDRPRQAAAKRANFQVRTLLEKDDVVYIRPDTGGRQRKYFLPMPEAFGFSGDVPWDAYTVGALLGDGGLTGSSVTFSTNDVEILGQLDVPEWRKKKGDNYDYSLLKTRSRCEEIGIWGARAWEKEIPDLYMKATPQHRLAILQGLFDTDGTPATAGRVEFSTSSPMLARQVRELVWSLGGTATMGVRDAPKYTYKGETRTGRPAYRVQVKLPGKLDCFRLSRHLKVAPSKRQREPYRALDRIEPIGRGPSTCIRVAAPDSLFVTRDGILTHNTLLTAVAPTLVQAVRPLLIIPAKLKKKTLREFKELAKHWKMAEIKVVSYAYLSRNKTFLEDYQPDLIMGDEFHKLKNLRAACTRQVDRYLTAHSECRLLGLSGTLMKRSLMDFHHMTRWVAGNEGMPLPSSQEEAKLWARAVDRDPPATRILPGWLALWREKGEQPTLDNIDKAVGRRIYSTPGFFRTEGIEYGGSLLIETLRTQLPTPVQDIVDQMMETKLTPNGDVALPSDIWRHKRELELGFYYEWDPKPPEEWLAARRIWRAFVREIIEADIGWDTEMQVANGCAGGKLDHHGRYTRWLNVRHIYKPNTVTRWVTDEILQNILVAHNKNAGARGPALLWVKHRAVGEKLAEMTGWRYFQSGGMAADGTYIESLEGKESAILSIGSNAEGLNLQAWSDNDVLSWPETGRLCEQMLARTHRAGQKQDEVNVRARIGLTDAFEQSLRDAQHIQNVQGAPQRLLMADLTSWDSTSTSKSKART